jgi:hypothetical protein
MLSQKQSDYELTESEYLLFQKARRSLLSKAMIDLVAATYGARIASNGRSLSIRRSGEMVCLDLHYCDVQSVLSQSKTSG